MASKTYRSKAGDGLVIAVPWGADARGFKRVTFKDGVFVTDDEKLQSALDTYALHGVAYVSEEQAQEKPVATVAETAEPDNRPGKIVYVSGVAGTHNFHPPLG